MSACADVFSVSPKCVQSDQSRLWGAELLLRPEPEILALKTNKHLVPFSVSWKAISLHQPFYLH